ncbi:unnamed protein product, partial [Allacma fusca]
MRSHSQDSQPTRIQSKQDYEIMRRQEFWKRFLFYTGIAL